MCMMNLACSGELESVYLQAGGEGPGLVMVVKNVWLHSEALFRIRRQS